MSNIIRVFKADGHAESSRFITDNDGDVQIHFEDSGRFTVKRYTGRVNADNEKLYQMIGNYSSEWSIEIQGQVRYEP